MAMYIGNKDGNAPAWTLPRVILLVTVERIGSIDQPREACSGSISYLANRQPGMPDPRSPTHKILPPAPQSNWVYYASVQSTCEAAFGAIYHKWSVEITWRFCFTHYSHNPSKTANPGKVETSTLFVGTIETDMVLEEYSRQHGVKC
jgi:hypothetical protein